MLNGIDYSYGNGLTAAEIKAGGKDFVCRYLSGGGSKDITKTELDNLTAAGLQVVFVWETDGLMPSEAQGESDAQGAQAELESLGCTDAVVFFAADAETMAHPLDYLAGANKVIGLERTGVYGGYGTVSDAFDHKVVTYGWQTYAWSNGQWDDRALLRQTSNNVTFGPASVDFDSAAYWNSTDILSTTDDYGQWPRPAAKPKPVDNTVSVPDVLGKAAGTAKTDIANAGLKIDCPAIPSGDTATIKTQTPVSGTKVAKGSTVTVTLDLIKPVTVPNLVGMTLDAAVKALTDLKLKDYAPAVDVSAQSPAAGSALRDGSTVKLTLTVSSQPAPAPAPTPAPASTDVEVPDVVGKTGSEAKTTLEAAGFKVVQDPATTPAGKTTKVTSQSPAAKAKAAKGSTVTVKVEVDTPKPVAEPVLQSGMSGAAVKLLQTLLNSKDKAGLTEDGIFGSATETAVRNFQTKNKLTVDGIVGPQTWAKLGNYS